MMIPRVVYNPMLRFGRLKPEQDAQYQAAKDGYDLDADAARAEARALLTNISPWGLILEIERLANKPGRDADVVHALEDHEWALAYRLKTMPMLDAVQAKRMDELKEKAGDESGGEKTRISMLRGQFLQTDQILRYLYKLEQLQEYQPSEPLFNTFMDALDRSRQPSAATIVEARQRILTQADMEAQLA